MRFVKEIRFPSDLTTVREMLLDPDFRAEVAEASGASEYEVSVEPSGAGWLAVVDSTAPTQGLPAAATKILGETMTIHQEELWGPAGTATLDATIPGRPGSIRGTITLRQDGEHVVQAVDAEIKVRILLVGGAVETLIGRGLGRVMKVQESVGADWLAR